ncbi:MAG TPA: Rrf2 family transcriptional regulator [Thermoguttaceae bacterium]|nr:Rrf2 family transcriptional regulator [Thermoguttaceae bacterium]
MKMSRTVAYAVQASIHLAQSQGKGPVPCSKLASEGKMPERFLLQILRHLVARGILASTRGVDGGYRLDRPADDVSLLELIEAIDGPLVTELPLGDGFGGKSRERLSEAISQVTQQMRAQLSAIKLSHLMPPDSKRGRS